MSQVHKTTPFPKSTASQLRSHLLRVVSAVEIHPVVGPKSIPNNSNGEGHFRLPWANGSMLRVNGSNHRYPSRPALGCVVLPVAPVLSFEGNFEGSPEGIGLRTSFLTDLLFDILDGSSFAVEAFNQSPKFYQSIPNLTKSS